MTICGACASENPDEFRFCGACGAPLAVPACPSCGATSPPGHRFCGQCGASLGDGVSPTLGRPAEERKLATVLFADVVGFTTMAETADPEDVARRVDAAFRGLAEVVAEHGGTVDKYMGDSLMAVFGVPQAHDDDAERAVAAGLAMRGVGGELGFSIGINTGEVMVTSLGEGGGVTVIGDTVNVAARLEKAAGCDEVLVGPLTAELARERVTFTERQPMLVKGRRLPVDVREAVGLRPVDHHDPAAWRPPLVGRDDEMAYLLSQWRRVLSDERSAEVALSGDAGVGKTRVLDELVSAVGEGVLTARTTYPAYGGLGGPRVAADILRQLGPTGRTDIDSRARSVAGELHPALRAIDPGALHQEQLWAFRRLLETKAAEQPLLLAVDDVHRAGEKMLDLLSELMARVVDAPVLLVLAGRPGPWMAQFPSATTVRLSPLSTPDATVLANALVPERPLSDEAAASLVSRAGGNPLYVRELLALVQTRGGLVASDGHYTLAADMALPPSLQAIMAARLDALRPAEKAALQHVAVLGNGATPEQVERLGLPGPQGPLRELLAVGLLRQQGDGRYDVADPLLREVAYETLPWSLRVERHKLAAEAASTVEDRARHLDRAVSYRPDDEALASEAAVELARAGVEALDAYRLADGVRLLQRAVDLGHRDVGDLLRLARALSDVNRHDDVLAVLNHLPDDIGDDGAEAERGHMRANSLQVRDPEAALAGLDRAAEEWARLGNVAKEGWAHANKGAALFNMGRVAESQGELDAALERFRRVDHTAGVMAVYGFLPIVAPDAPEGASWLAESLAYAEDLGDRTRQVRALESLAWHHYMRLRYGDEATVALAEETALRLAELATELGVPDVDVHGLCIAADLARRTGRLDLAKARARQASVLSQGAAPSSEALARAALFSAELATGSTEPTPSLNVSSADPITSMAAIIHLEAMVFAGRRGDALERADVAQDRHGLGPLQALVGGVPEAVLRVVAGDLEGALRAARRSHASALAAGAAPVAAAAAAVWAEANAHLGESAVEESEEEALDLDGDDEDGLSIAGLLALRARAASGDGDAAQALAEQARALAAPGLARE